MVRRWFYFCLLMMVIGATLLASSHAISNADSNTGSNAESNSNNPSDGSMTQKELSVSNAWIRKPMSVQKTGAMYFTIENLSKQTLVLEGVETAVARHTMMHETIEEAGVAKMRHQDQVTLRAGETVHFKPGGLHIMLMGLQHPIELDNEYPVTLYYRIPSSNGADTASRKHRFTFNATVINR